MFDYKKVITNKKARLTILNILRFIPDKPMLKIEYFIRTGEKLNLKNPVLFTEKLQWLKLYNRKDIYSDMVDKILAKKYIAEKVGEEYVVPLLGEWDSFDQIDFSKLPDKFILKCNHDSGSVILCENKDSFDFISAKKELSFHLKIDEYLLGREWPYKNVKRKIIAEEFLKGSEGSSGFAIKDYKFFCFNGKPKVMYISNDRGDDSRTDFFDMDFNHLPLKMKDPNADICPEKPEKFDDMKRISEILSEGIPHLRVDFYYVKGKIYVGELTFFHNSGFTKVHPEEWNKIMGGWIDLSSVCNVNEE